MEQHKNEIVRVLEQVFMECEPDLGFKVSWLYKQIQNSNECFNNPTFLKELKEVLFNIESYLPTHSELEYDEYANEKFKLIEDKNSLITLLYNQ